MAWQQGGGFYPGQQGPPPPGFYPGGPAPGGYPPPPGSGGYPGAGYPPGGGYPPGAGYPPGPGYPPTASYPPPTAGGYPGGVSAGAEVGGGNMYNSGGYGEDPMEASRGFDFSDKTIRQGFIRKVYSILMVQLTVTMGFIALFSFHDGVKAFVMRNSSLVWVAFGVTLVCMIVMACCGDVRRKSPMNFIFLGIFTLAESFLLGSISSVYAPHEVFTAVAICAVVTLGLTIFAFQTKIDFTMMGGILFVCSLILLIFGIVAMFWHDKIVTLVYSAFGALLFSIYIVYDTQIMIGGNHKYAISPEEYIFAALNLYIDIVQLFLYILTIIGASRD